ncbi:hypothetical protein LPJ81_005949, partial [Coemansia sp. IMI 209127]
MRIVTALAAIAVVAAAGEAHYEAYPAPGQEIAPPPPPPPPPPPAVMPAHEEHPVGYEEHPIMPPPPPPHAEMPVHEEHPVGYEEHP